MGTLKFQRVIKYLFRISLATEKCIVFMIKNKFQKSLTESMMNLTISTFATC